MKPTMHKNVRRLAAKLLAGGLLGASLFGAAGCVVRAEPGPHYYYRTRVVYTPDGPVYVRERVYGYAYEPAPAYAPAPAYTAAPTPPPAPESPAATALQPLVAPVALYPDPLVAVVLPAATYPQQVQDANAWLASYPAPPQGAIDAQPWAPAIKALVHYPTVLQQLARDPQWTQSLGSAYINQPQDVMAAIQQLRAQAMVQGNLVNTPQQVVVQDGGTIAIEPANPDVIYVPEYDPVTVYVGYHPIYYSSVAYPIGPWFVNGIYWGGGVIFVGDWHGGYYYRDGRWGRDYAWHPDRGRYWAHDSRWGPAPHVEAGHYAYAHDIRGREGELHHAMADRSAQRRDMRSAGPQHSASHGQSESHAQGHGESHFQEGGREGERK